MGGWGGGAAFVRSSVLTLMGIARGPAGEMWLFQGSPCAPNLPFSPFSSVSHCPPPKKAADGKKCTVVLDPKRSNAINIGLTVLPPVHIIKTAILSFDEFAINKEGIEVSCSDSSHEPFLGSKCFRVKSR